MSRLVADSAFDMSDLLQNGSISEFFEWGTVTTGTDTTLVVEYSDETIDEELTLTGTFADYADGFPTTGTITAISYWLNGSTLYEFTEVSISVEAFTAYANADDLPGLFGELLGGNDDIDGSTGDDVLQGFDGDDLINGLEGNDILRGGLGSDQLHGDAGHDLLAESSGDSGPFGDDLYDGGSGNDRVSYFSDFVAGVTVDLNITTGQVTGHGTDTLVSIEHVTATYGDDTLTGNADANWFWTFGGLDVLNGNGGDDYFTVGAGDKFIDGGSGVDTVEISDTAYAPLYTAEGISFSLAPTAGSTQHVGTGAWTLTNVENLGGSWGSDELTGDDNANVLAGQLGDDELTGGGGNDVLAGDGTFVMGDDGVQQFVEIDTLDGPGGNDHLAGDDGNDRLIGGGGNDVLRGGLGDDQLYGGDGNDLLSEDSGTSGPFGDDLYDGGNGTDRVSYFADFGPGISVNLNVTTAQNTGQGLDTFVSIDHVTATYGDDTLVGNGAANWFWTFSGTDTLSGNGGNDYFTVGLGNKTADGGSGIDTIEIYDLAWEPLYTAAGITVSLALQGSAQQTGVGAWTISNMENLGGYFGADELTGDGNANILAGGQGDDTLAGGSGNDTLAGDGTFDLDANAAPSLIAKPGWDGGDDLLDGGAGNDIMYGDGGNDTIDGGTGGDLMDGGSGNDRYYVGNAFDSVVEEAAAGNDSVYSTISYVLGDNVENLWLLGSTAINATGNARNNLLVGNSGANVLNGGAGADRLGGGTGNDTFYVDNSGDQVIEYASAGTDTVYSTISHVLADNVETLRLLGSSSINGTGNALSNVLAGNSGANTLNGGAGNDKLYGAQGADHLWGGTGADEFAFATGHFGGFSAATAERIHDFSHAQGDTINLQQIDANALVSGNQGFTFIGGQSFHNVAGELRSVKSASYTYLYGDTNGDGTADFLILLDGQHSLAGGDFIL